MMDPPPEIPPAPPLVAPPPPQRSSSMPPSSRNLQTYRNARESELEQLRQRGLAKLLNKHFTSVTQSIAEERAAANAALRDLEARKAAGLKDWSDGSGTGELSVWDKLYLELQQKKAECKRKEKETLLLYQRYVAKFGGTGVVQVPSTSSQTNHDHSYTYPPLSPRDGMPDTPQSRVPFLAGQIEDNLSKLVSSGAERHPSIQFLGTDETYQTMFASMDEKQRIDYLRTLEGRGVDARTSTPTPAEQRKRLPTPTSSARVGFPDSTPETTKLMFGGGKLWDSNNDTPVSQLTTTTASSTNFDDDSPSSSPREALEHPLADDDDEIKSSVSELTSVHSLVLSDAEDRLVEFLTTETEAIRQTLDEEECSHKSTYSSEVGSTSARAADQAENMVYQMQEILRNFQQQQETSNDAADAATDIIHEPRPYDTGNPNEQWMVYFDETYQREYYHERNSNKTQWTPPPKGDETSVLVSDYTSTSPRKAQESAPLSHLEVMPEQSFGMSSGSHHHRSRREEYRRKRRRRRNRRRALLAVVALCMFGGGYYMTQHHSQAVEQMASKVIDVNKLESALSYVVSEETASSIMTKVKSYLPDSMIRGADRKTKEKELKAKKLQEEKAVKAEKLQEEQAPKKEEEERKLRLDAERIAKEIVRAQEEARLEIERRQAERLVEAKKEHRRVKSLLEVMLEAPRPL